jgi:L-fuculose-phosphate aldolase
MMTADSITPGHAKPESELRRDLCVAGRWLYERGFAVGTEGNLSVRLDDARILTTPCGACKGRMAPEDLVITDLEGRKLEGAYSPSSELSMHLLFYRLRTDVRAICHAHPPIATGFAAAGRALDKAMLPEIVVALGYIPLAQYATPGTPDLSAALAPFVPHHDAILMANHGVVVSGPDLLSAFCRMEAVEQFAKTTLVTELLGRQTLLSDSDVETLLEARARYGVTPPPGSHAARPLTREAAASAHSAGFTSSSHGPSMRSSHAPLPSTSGDSDTSATDRITLTRAELDALIEDALRRSRPPR